MARAVSLDRGATKLPVQVPFTPARRCSGPFTQIVAVASIVAAIIAIAGHETLWDEVYAQVAAHAVLHAQNKALEA